MSYSRGDVVLVLFPNSDLRTAKQRPALVVQADGLGTGLPQTILATITSNMARAGHRCRVGIDLGTPAGLQSGLRLDSVVMLDHVTTVRDTEINRVIGSLPDMTAVDDALRCTFGLGGPQDEGP